MFVTCQGLHSLDTHRMETIIGSISPTRLAAYKAATASTADALALYQSNARFSGLLLETIGGFEIVLRNAVVTSITNHFDRPDWYRARAFTQRLDARRRTNIWEARRALGNRTRQPNSDRIVAELTFNFWVALHEGKYRETFWIPFLRTVWPAGEDVRKLHKDLLRIRDLRNRIAHHEPVFSSRWRESSALVLHRLKQLSPHHHAWLSGRVSMELTDVCANITSVVECE